MIRLLSPAVLAVSLIVALFGVAHAQEDITPPSLLDVTFEPEIIDTSKGPQVVTVTIHITDDLSGVAGAYLQFVKPGTTQGASVEFRPGTPFSELIDGDLLDGSHVATMTIPQYAAYGTWEMFYLMTIDNVGNRVDLWRPEGTNERLSDDDWPTIFNGFNFEIGAAADVPHQPTQQLFMPLLNQ